MLKLLHVSDLHFGRTDRLALRGLARSVETLAPAAVVATGDITQSGRRSEYRAAAEFFDELRAPIFAVPGNHDAPVYSLAQRFVAPWRRFERHIGESRLQVLDLPGLAIIGINTARRAAPRLNWSFGTVRRSDIEAAGRIARGRAGAGLVFVAAHHPFVRGPGVAGSQTVGRARQALDAFADAGVSAVLTGHVHATSVAPIEATESRILSIGAGSATSTRQRTEPASFCELAVRQGNHPRLTAVQYAFAGQSFTPRTRYAFERCEGRWAAATAPSDL